MTQNANMWYRPLAGTRKLSELSNDEILEAYYNDDKFQRYIDDRIYAWTLDAWIDYMHCFKDDAIDYCIGYDRGHYILCLKPEEFINGCEKVQHDFECFPDWFVDMITRGRELIDYPSEDEDANWAAIKILTDEMAYKLDTLSQDDFERERDDYEILDAIWNELGNYDWTLDDEGNITDMIC